MNIIMTSFAALNVQGIREILDEIEERFPESLSPIDEYEVGEIQEHLRRRRTLRADEVKPRFISLSAHLIPLLLSQQ